MIKLNLQFAAAITWAAAALGLASSNTAIAAGAVCLPFGDIQADATNVDTLQRGAKLYFNYCASCHSLQYMRYGRLAQDLQLSEDDLLKNFAFTGAKAGDFVTISMPKGGRGNPAGSQEWFGVTPPDLSLVARSRGVDWIYNYLNAYYPDPSRPIGWNNLTFPNSSMPNPLWELQGIQEHVVHGHAGDAHAGGAKAADAHADCSPSAFKKVSEGSRSAEQYDKDTRDLTTFLEYVGEPAIIKRESYGVWAILYLSLLTMLFWLLKNEYWKDIH
jgi:ubiquinol-cytochrome c reductase cytochrome c1 subunit